MGTRRPAGYRHNPAGRLRGGLARFKRPREYVFVKAIPRSASGKLLRRKLRTGEYEAFAGNKVTVKNAVLVWDKVTIEDEVFLGPNMVFTNDMNPRNAFKNSPDKFLPTLVKKNASNRLLMSPFAACRSVR